MQDSATATTPIATATKFDHDKGTKVDVTNYRGMIGSLLYLISSRPDIMYATFSKPQLESAPPVK